MFSLLAYGSIGCQFSSLSKVLFVKVEEEGRTAKFAVGLGQHRVNDIVKLNGSVGCDAKRKIPDPLVLTEWAVDKEDWYRFGCMMECEGNGHQNVIVAWEAT